MAAIAIPDDVAAHLQAAIQLSNRRLQMRMLSEADIVLRQQLPLAAVIIASAVLESVLEGLPLPQYGSRLAEIERWRTLRNNAAHSTSSELTLGQATALVRGIRDLVTELVPGTETGLGKGATPVNQLRGKYKYVPTSSTAFMERKADELDLEL